MKPTGKYPAPWHRTALAVALATVAFPTCRGGSETGGTGGTAGTGGVSSAGGSAGTANTGGTAATGGTDGTETGGSPGSGGETGTGGAAGAGNAGGATGSGGAAGGAGGAVEPSMTFATIYESIIVPKCGGASCHLPGTNTNNYFGYSPELQMPDTVTALANLINIRASCRNIIDPRSRVVPYDPAASAIMYVDKDGLCARRHNVVVPTVTAEDMASIDAWIASGAR